MKNSRGRKESVWTAAFLPLFVLAAVFATWPLAISSQPHDHADTLFNSWLIQWNIHAASSGQNPLQLPIFSGFPDGNGRNDFLLTQSIAALPFKLMGTGHIRTHNMLLVLFLALTGFSTALLAREAGGSTGAALFSGWAAVLLPYFQSHLWHIQLFSTWLALLTVFFSLRYLRGKSTGWLIPLFILLQCLASLYLWIFLNILLCLLTAFALFKLRKNRTRLAGCIGWWAGGNAICVPFLLSHLRNAHPWHVDTMASTDVLSFLSPWSSSVLLGWMRSVHAHPEAALWPGLFTAIGLVWFVIKGRKEWIDWFLISCIGIFALLSLGPTLSFAGRGIAPAPFRYIAELPGISGIRLPARGAIFALIPAAILAGKQLGSKKILVAAGMLVSAAAVYHKPISTEPLQQQPWHQWIAEQDFSRVIYLPVSGDLDRPEMETERLAGAIGHFTPSVNGYSTTLPRDYQRVATVLNSWPSPDAKRMVEGFQADCIIIQGWAPFEADTVFTLGRLTVSAVVTALH